MSDFTLLPYQRKRFGYPHFKLHSEGTAGSPILCRRHPDFLDAMFAEVTHTDCFSI